MIDAYLEKQQDLTAVEKFSQAYDFQRLPQEENRYKELIPKSTPGPGQQYAFEVDLDKCTGCKACVTACHNENGLDEDETWRSVGLLAGGTSEETTDAAFRSEFGRKPGPTSKSGSKGHPGHDPQPALFPAYFSIRKRVRSRIKREVKAAAKAVAARNK